MDISVSSGLHNLKTWCVHFKSNVSYMSAPLNSADNPVCSTKQCEQNEVLSVIWCEHLKSLLSLFGGVVCLQPNQIICPLHRCVCVCVALFCCSQFILTVLRCQITVQHTTSGESLTQIHTNFTNTEDGGIKPIHRQPQ